MILRRDAIVSCFKDRPARDIVQMNFTIMFTFESNILLGSVKCIA